MTEVEKRKEQIVAKAKEIAKKEMIMEGLSGVAELMDLVELLEEAERNENAG